jgi:hypothetical protein
MQSAPTPLPRRAERASAFAAVARGEWDGLVVRNRLILGRSDR